MTTTTIARAPLARSRRAVLGGACVGLARHLGWNVTATRVLFIALALFGGAGVLFYAWLWALVPLEPSDDEAPDAVRRSTPVAILFVAVAAVAAFVSVLVRSDDNTSIALVAVTLAGGAAVAWNLLVDRNDPHRGEAYGRVVRTLAVLFIIIPGVAALTSRPSATNAVLGVGMLVVGVAVLAAPRITRLWSDLMAERATRVRQEQRAEIAAHLHDSVLQTLALIQNRAGASSEVARIARAQERELRDWLFAGDAVAPVDLAIELNEVAAAIELDYPVRIELVAAGESAGLSSQAIVAASREAMINAARHAGGDVSVYLESSPSAVDVFVRDRGPGVDLDALPADRLGIRESIVGRMTRAGGTATVRPGAGGTGTEVHLHLDVASVPGGTE